IVETVPRVVGTIGIVRPVQGCFGIPVIKNCAEDLSAVVLETLGGCKGRSVLCLMCPDNQDDGVGRTGQDPGVRNAQDRSRVDQYGVKCLAEPVDQLLHSCGVEKTGQIRSRGTGGKKVQIGYGSLPHQGLIEISSNRCSFVQN